ncbi:MAG: homoserine dehydrogenase [Actinobacteria bacterium]|nr:homoserine dehydrogenase [Actinomycetota bacterium]
MNTSGPPREGVSSGPGSNGRPLRVGVLGCGNVGAALVGLLTDDSSTITARTGVALEVAKIGVRNLSASRAVQVSAELFTRDTQAMVNDPNIDIIVETIGGIEPARALLLTALKNGKPVITANKELIANCGAELFETAATAGVDLFFEAAVAGGIPVMRALQQSLAGEQITRIMGIVNGTTNFILTKMTEEGAAYADVLTEAQQLGYAEADPTADVEGFDAGAKAAIIASVAFGLNVVAGDVYQEGISRITPSDIAAAARLDHVIKLLAIIERHGDEVAVRVHPAMVPNTHPLATVRDSFNAVFIHGEAVDDLMLYGRGAGGAPTASAMLGDVLSAASNLRRGSASDPIQLKPAKVMAIDQTSSAFYLALDVADHSGVLAEVAAVFGAYDVSIRSMEQHGVGDRARITFITHRALEADVQATLSGLSNLGAVHNVGAVIRVVSE